MKQKKAVVPRAYKCSYCGWRTGLTSRKPKICNHCGRKRIAAVERVDVSTLGIEAHNTAVNHISTYSITRDGFDITAILAVFWSRLEKTSPTELELSAYEIVKAVGLSEKRKLDVRRRLIELVALGILHKNG